MSEQLRETLPRCGEWVGGITVLPSWVYGEGEPYRPEALLWIEIATGLIVGMEMVKPGEALIEARCSFERASQAPHAGAPRMPRRVRVASPDLAASLRMHGLEVICAPTPELDAAIASMRAHMSRSPEATDEPATYLGRGITSEDMRHFFEASAHLYRACPWEIIPADEHLSITCDALGISGGALIVVGQMGESFGFALFRTHEDLFCYLEALDQIEDGARPELPRHWMFSFDDREEVEPELSSEIASHDWPIAGPAAIPKVVVFDGDSVRDVTRDELTGIAAVASVLADFIEGDPRLRGAWMQGEPVGWVGSSEGISVELGAPCAIDVDGDAGVFMREDAAASECIVDPDGDLDEDELDAYEDALLSRFAESPEGEPFSGDAAGRAARFSIWKPGR